MINVIFENIAQLLIVGPIIWISLKDKDPETFKTLFIFALYFLVRIILLHLPVEFPKTNVLEGNWNWTGKSYALLSSIIFLAVYRKYQLKDYYLTFHQDRSFLMKGGLIVTGLLVLGSMISLIFGTRLVWNWETIFFQLTMPGLDEEIAYRGIMLGLLMKILKPAIQIKKLKFGNPSILVTAILFGFAHGLFVTESWGLEFRIYPFVRTTIMGLIWGWVTVKSGSILLALLAHSIGNVSDKFIRMR